MRLIIYRGLFNDNKCRGIDLRVVSGVDLVCSFNGLKWNKHKTTTTIRVNLNSRSKATTTITLPTGGSVLELVDIQQFGRR